MNTIDVDTPKPKTKTKLIGAEYAKWYLKECRRLHINYTLISCGVYQVNDLLFMAKGVPNRATGMDHVVHALDRMVPPPSEGLPLGYFKTDDNGWRKCAFFIFSDTDRLGNGIALAKAITDNNLGTVTETAEVKINPNSHNPIRVWCWAPDHEAVRKFVDNHQWGQGIPDQEVLL